MRGLCLVALIAAGLLAIVPFVADPMLDIAVDALDEISAGAFLGSLVGVLVLVAIPVLLLGTVSPWAIRLAVSSVEEAGTVAGPPVRALDGRLARRHARLGAAPDPARRHAPHLPHLRARDRAGRGRRAAPGAPLGARAGGDRAADRAAGRDAQGQDRGRRARDPRGGDRVPVRARDRVPGRRALARAERGPGAALDLHRRVRARPGRPAQRLVGAHRRRLGRPPRAARSRGRSEPPAARGDPRQRRRHDLARLRVLLPAHARRRSRDRRRAVRHRARVLRHEQPAPAPLPRGRAPLPAPHRRPLRRDLGRRLPPALHPLLPDHRGVLRDRARPARAGRRADRERRATPRTRTSSRRC